MDYRYLANLVFALLLSPLVRAEAPFASQRLATIPNGSTAFSFENSRGQSLSRSSCSATILQGPLAQPLGEGSDCSRHLARRRSFRYIPLANALYREGYGPIYVLEHINQGKLRSRPDESTSLSLRKSFR